ncbi:MAG: hypothetical protein ACJ795_01040 [Ktedonobacteraceae bacterium]
MAIYLPKLAASFRCFAIVMPSMLLKEQDAPFIIALAIVIERVKEHYEKKESV